MEYDLEKNYVLELLDRAIRMHQHINAIETEFYRGGVVAQANSLDNAPEFLESFRHATHEVIASCSKLLKKLRNNPTSSDAMTIFKVTQSGLMLLKEMHEIGLANLPRPAVPIELSRFTRIIGEHVFKEPTLKIALYVSENVTETAFASDPLGKIRSSHLKNFLDFVNSFELLPDEENHQVKNENSIDITIPRIDIHCPMTWPTLFHEAAHSLLTTELRGKQTFVERIKEKIGNSLFAHLETLNVNLESWATEVWCDLFGAYVIGPSFFFSQYYSFIAVPPLNGGLHKDHPPACLRLKLIKAFLGHRNPIIKNEKLSRIIDSHIKLVQKIDEHHIGNPNQKTGLRIFSDVMRFQFRVTFFTGTEPEATTFQEKFRSMVDVVNQIETERLFLIYEELKEGLPAPSIRVTEDYTHEKPTSVQEVLLASCYLREDYLLPKLDNLLTTETIGNESIVEQLVNVYDKVDETVLRSLQLSEWLFMFDQKPQDLSLTNIPNVDSIKTNITPLLSDREIYSLLKSGELRVTPLVNLKQQLGSSSLDLRLGTSFEIFLPNNRHPLGEDFRDLEHYHSKRIDLDFLEHIVLLPGEFMLAHSFEYLSLPNWLAGELDGRSTYARLGLEIHMTAGMIDPGFEGTTTFELFNGGPNSIRLFPGLRVAQLRFRSVNPPEFPYSSKMNAKYRGRLQHHRSLYKEDDDYKSIYKEIKKRENKSR